MTAQDIKDIVEEKCNLIAKVEAENPGLRVFAVDVEDIPLQALQKYADITGEKIEYIEARGFMRVHYSHYPYAIFLSSVPVQVETVVKEKP